MNTLQKIFESLIHDTLSFKKIGTRLIEKKFRSIGISLSAEQLQEIESKLENLKENGELTLDIPDDQLLASNLNPPELRDGKLELQLDAGGDIDALLSNLLEKISSTIPEIASETSQLLLDRLKADAPSMLIEHKAQRDEFQANVSNTWGRSLDLLETFIVIALEAGGNFNEEGRAKAAEEHNYVFDAVTRLHARACQVASEILTLLRAGYADGAHARWRSLHEIAVVALFVSKQGQETAERYLLHNTIESYKAANEYQKHCLALGHELIPPHEFSEIKHQYDQLLNRFGASYKESCGWASHVIIKKDIKISDIEQAVGLEYLRPYYRLASHNVHANPKGVFFKLGLYSENEDLLLAGPSNAGLADPTHGTAISLLQATIPLLTLEPNLDRLVICNALMKLEREIGDELLSMHEELEKHRAA